MSNYYGYRDVKVLIAEKLMTMDGWKVYGYSPDNSDPYTDYYDPAYWGGIAEKNGYILCVGINREAQAEEIRDYINGNAVDTSIYEKIEKLQEMTIDRGATEGEAATAQKMIERLQDKLSEQQEQARQYTVTGTIPAHMANPPRMNWHIEKDGVYIAKGNGILKYSSIWYDYKHQDRDILDSHRELIKQFDAFINKIDTTCGGMIGNGDLETYEKVKVTEYKRENVAVEDADGCIKEGQCFIVKTSFNYGHNKDYVYKIHETEYNGKKSYYAYKLNGKLTKECTGQANPGNYWRISDNFLKWFEKRALAWCHIEEVNTPYEVEKVVKKVIKSEQKQRNATESKPAEGVDKYTYKVSEDVDTRTNEKIYLVKIVEKLTKDEYINVNKYIKSLGGYYSKFKHAFLFKENPSELLSIA